MNETKPSKLHEQMNYEQYTSLYQIEGYQYTKQDMAALKWLILETMAILSGQSTPEKHEPNPAVEVKWNVPKLSTKPVISVNLYLTHIVKQPENQNKGIYATYTSWLRRVDEQNNWYLADIDCTGNYGRDMAQFSIEDFQQLGLVQTRKYKLLDLPRIKQEEYSDNFLPENASDDKIYSLIAPSNYAFYEFEAIQNGHKLKLTFVVSMQREHENKKSGLPLAWHKLYIERIE